MENGPVEGAFTVYEDLLAYKSGNFMIISVEKNIINSVFKRCL